MTVRTTDPLTRQMLAYSRLIIREALRHGGSGWLEYNRVFRRQLAIDPSMSWNNLQPSLLAATALDQPGPNPPGSFCSLCRECDHTASLCALAPSQQAVYSTRSNSSASSVPSGSRSLKRPEMLLNIIMCQLEQRML